MVSIINITTTSMRVVWSSHGDHVAHYNIELFYGTTEWGDPVPGKQVYGISSGSRGYNFNGLEPGRQYFVKLYSKNVSQVVIRIETETFMTKAADLPVPSAPTLYLQAVGESIRAYGVAGANTNFIQFEIGGQLAGVVFVSGGQSYDRNIPAEYGYTYSVKAVPYGTEGQIGISVTKSITLTEPLPDPPPAPTGLNMYASTETSASFAWNAAPRAEKYAMEIFQNNVVIKYDYNIYATTKTFTGLSPGVSYVVKLYGWNKGGNGTPISYHFSLGYARPNNFGWSITKERGRSYSLTNGRYTNLVNYDEFLAIRQRINDFRRYKRLTAYTFSNVGRGVVLTAALYNELNDAIAGMSPPTSTPGRKSSGTANLPALLNGLVSALNSIK